MFSKQVLTCEVLDIDVGTGLDEFLGLLTVPSYASYV